MNNLVKHILIFAFISIALFGCGPKIISFGDTSNIKSELISLSYHKLKKEIVDEELITTYKDFDLIRVSKDMETQYYISDEKILSFKNRKVDSTLRGVCHDNQVFKKNFLLISKYDCWAASPMTVRRDNTLIIDLNSKKIYKIEFGSIELNTSKSYIDYSCLNCKNTFAILNIDLEEETIIIHNNFEKRSVKIIPYKSDVF